MFLVLVPLSGTPPGDPRDANVPPVAAAGADKTGVVGAPVAFDGSASYDPDVTGSWSVGPPMAKKRGQVAGAVLGTDFYVIGGYQRNSTAERPGVVPDNEVLDTAMMTWSSRAPMPAARRLGAGLAVGPSVRVFGGYVSDDIGFVDVVDDYHPADDRWSMLSPLPRREQALVAPLGGHTYLWVNEFRELYRQPAGGGSWQQLSSPAKSTFAPSLVAVGSTLYLVGWNNAPASAPILYAYDPHMDAWSERAPLGQIRCNHGAVSFRGLLIVLSGETCAGQDAFVPEVEAYDPRTDTWHAMPPIPTPRDEFASGVVGDCIYTAGGSWYNHVAQFDITEIYCAPLEFAWDFGDGAMATGEWATHAYAAPGMYTVTLTVTDPLGAQGVDTLTVHVEGTTGEVDATIDFDPDTLNPRSNGKWATVYIELPAALDPEDIDAATIRLNDVLAPVLDPRYGFVRDPAGYLVDHDGDGIVGRMVKFDRAEVLRLLPVGTNPVLITGRLMDGTAFSGMSDPVRVLP